MTKKEPAPSSRAERRKLARANRRASGRAIIKADMQQKRASLWKKEKAKRKQAKKDRRRNNG